MSFLGGIFGGSDPTLNQDINQAGQIAGWATGMGEGDLGIASDFYRKILQGGGMDVLAPQIGGIQQRAGQAKKTTAEFGSRGGGTGAAMQSIDDSTRAQINDMIANLTGNAASSLAGIGSSTLNTGLSANSQQANLAQQRLQNWLNSILGGVTSTGISGVLGRIPGLKNIF